MKVFQIGAAGGIGRQLARRLVDNGDQVTGMNPDPAQADTGRDSGAKRLAADLIHDTVGARWPRRSRVMERVPARRYGSQRHLRAGSRLGWRPDRPPPYHVPTAGLRNAPANVPE